MHFRHISARLLLLSSVSGTVIPEEDEVFSIQSCSDVRWDSNSTGLQIVNCIEHFDGPGDDSSESATSDSCPSSTVYTNTTSSNDTAHAIDARYLPNHADAREKGLHACYNKDLSYRSKMLPISNENTKSWCFREGALPKASDLDKLCTSASKKFDKELFQIQRAKRSKSSVKDNNGSCFCTILREGTAGLKLCNCDRCDALHLDFSVGDMCRALQKGCIQELYGSGYMRTKNPNAVYALYGHRDNKGRIKQQIELDPVLGVDGVLPSTCKSGDENRHFQDYTALFNDCKWISGRTTPKCTHVKKKKSNNFWNTTSTDN